LLFAQLPIQMQALADKKKAITDDDLMDLVTLDQEQQQGHGQWELGYIQVTTWCENNMLESCM
jgi:hypothetical protein